MRKLTILSLVFAIGLITAGSFLTVQTSGHKRSKFHRSDKPVEGRYIVVLDEEQVGTFAESPQIEAEAQFLSYVYGGSVHGVYSSAIKGYSAEMSPRQAEELSLDSRVLFVEEDTEIGVSATQTNAPWNLDRTDQRTLPLDNSYEYSQNGSGAHVYILDTGIRTSHQEFGGRASVSLDVIGDGQNGQDCHGHGTHVAGTVGGQTYGVAKNVWLHAVRVLPCGGSGQISDLLTGIDWVKANRVNPAVANISITAPGTSPSLETAVTNAVASGVVFTIAAGNNQWNACDYTPARTPTAITVAATAEADDKALYSNYGPCVDLFAPGNAVTSAGTASDTATRVLSGTSMSAPLVAGVAAIYRAANPSANPASVASAINNAATVGVITNMDVTSPNKLLYAWLVGAPSPTPTPTPTPTVTPSPTATPTPTTQPGRITIRKRVLNGTGGTSSTTVFPYQATNIQTSSFALVNDQEFVDPNVPGNSQVVSVTEAAVSGWRLVSVACTETPGGSPNIPNTTVDLGNRRANIAVENGESVTCTFTSEELIPTAGDVSISGRVVDWRGRGVRGIPLFLRDGSTGETTQVFSNNFGYYTFNAVRVGRFYILNAQSTKRYLIMDEQRSFTVNDSLSNIDFFIEDPD